MSFPQAPIKSILKKPQTSSNNASDFHFSTSKKDKRRMKHSLLVSKITKSATPKPRRRRPNKKLVTTLESLADALPLDDDQPSASIAGRRPQDQVNIIKRKSIKSRPGAMKRREKLERGERDRFAKNMAQMTASSDNSERLQSQSPSPFAQRMSALRGFIAQTLEQKPELKPVNG
jgi:hypothetical protein